MKKMLALLAMASTFCFVNAMQERAETPEDAIARLTPEELKFAQELAAKNIMNVVDRCDQDKEQIKKSLLVRIKDLGSSIFVEDGKNIVGSTCLFAGSFLLQTIFVYEIILAAVALYACLYGICFAGTYFLAFSNFLMGYFSPLAMLTLAHKVYIGVLFGLINITLFCGALASIPVLCQKFNAMILGRVGKDQIFDSKEAMLGVTSLA